MEDSFSPDEEMQNTFMTSEIARNVLKLQCIFCSARSEKGKFYQTRNNWRRRAQGNLIYFKT
jgi:hypothetical protein